MNSGPENKKALPLNLFIALSFAVFAILFFVFSGLLSGLDRATVQGAAGPIKDAPIRFKQADPLLTKMPGLSDVLDGPIISSNDPVLGALAANITLVEFSDFTCEFCRTQEKTLFSVLAAYPGQVKLIWKDYPDGNADSVSRQAAIAGRCAAAKGKFWPMHDLMFNEKNLDTGSIIALAEKLGFGGGEFRRCLADKNMKKLVDDNIREANALDIKGVPFIFVNEKGFLGEVSLEELTTTVESEIKKLQNPNAK
jgi:predicted DsbA family dithiol-disulfide isomerase